MFQSEIRYRNLETGEDILIEEIMDGSGMAMANGILYYTKYEYEYGKSLLTVSLAASAAVMLTEWAMVLFA